MYRQIALTAVIIMSIRLHPEKGVNPRLSYCPRCGGDSNELFLIGANEWIYECSACSQKIIGYPRLGMCPECKNRGVTRYRKLDEHEKLPGSLCSACVKEVAEHKAIVAEGGVYWRCLKCEKSGVIRGESELAIAVRKAHGIEAPDPCGIEFSLEEPCPVCTGDYDPSQDDESSAETS